MEPSGCTHSIYHNSSFRNHSPTERWCAGLRVRRNATHFVHGGSRTISSFWGQPILPALGNVPRSFSTRRLLKEMRGSPWWKTRLFRCRLSTPHSRILFNSGVSTHRQRFAGVVLPKRLSRHRSSWRVTEAHRARSCSRTTPAQREPTKRSGFVVLETTHSSYYDECQGAPTGAARNVRRKYA